MAVPATVAEFIYIQLRPSVKPEDPSSDEGQSLLSLFQATKQQSGHKSSAWGRTVEDENTLVWVIEWTDAHDGAQPTLLTPYLAPSTTPTILYTTLTPPITETETLTTNPITELCALAFPSTFTPDQHASLTTDLIGFRTALTEKLDRGKGPKSWAMGYVERPGTVPHEKSESLEAFVHLLVVGWESVEAHMEAKGTGEFLEGIGPIREKMLGALPGVGMRHVAFKRV